MMERYPIKNGTIIQINGVSIRVDDCVGEGTTCLVYHGRVLDNDLLIPKTRVVIKEFYPQSDDRIFDITRNADGKLSVRGLTSEDSEYKERKMQFDTGYRMQCYLANSDVMEVMVKPLLYGEYGDTSYLVSDIHMGKSLDKVAFETLEEKLACAVRVAELFGILHEAGYMMLDFKPENLLWTERPKSVKLIDTDSIFQYRKVQAAYGGQDDVAIDVGEADVFYTNQKYGAPEIILLKEMLEMGAADFEEKKAFYFVPNVNVYNLGYYLFELLYERMPSEEDRKFPERLKEELYNRYQSRFGNRKTAENLLDVLKKSLQGKCGDRYPDGYRMMYGLNTSMEEITSRRYIPRKAAAKANHTYLSYNLLEKYPLYEYSHKDNGKTILDVAIVGAHSFREAFLKAVISCGQMLESTLNIRLFAKDAVEFWEYYKSGRCNPEVGRTLQWYINGQPCGNSEEMENAEIVESPLAYVYLETGDSEEHVAEFIEKSGTAYIVFAYGQEEQDYERTMSLIKRLPKRKHFIGYLSDDQERLEEKKGKVDIFPISMEKVSRGYNENAFKSQIYKMGMSIHEYYYKRDHPRATKEEIESSYAGDMYNIESSERSALHANYKLKSIGIDPKSAEAPYLYYEKVLSSKTEEAKELFDKLAVLEHRSWTAFLVLSGVRAVDDAGERLRQYAYIGKSDWKERDKSGQVVAHPCLKASRQGRKLTRDIWEWYRNGGLSKDILEKLDPLDKRCLEIYGAIYQKSQERQKDVEQRLADMENDLQNAGEAVKAAYDSLCSAEGRLSGKDIGETNGSILWRQALEEFMEACAEEGILSKSLKEKIADIEKLMKPVLWCTSYHDFKEADEDILRALPRILIQNGKIEQKNAQITIVKPLVKDAWKNIYSTMIIQPDLLVLVPFHGEEEAVSEQYAAWLKHCRIDTKVQIRTLSQLRTYGGGNGQIFIDETGADAKSCRAVKENPYMRNAHLFQIEDRKLVPTDENFLITLFNRPVNLTVQETLMLHGAEMISEKKENGILGLSVQQYKSLWNLYRSLQDGRKWKIFINELWRLEEAKQIKAELGKKGVPVRYEAGYAEGSVIKQARIGKVFAELSAYGFVADYRLPGENDYGLVFFSAPYQTIGEMLKRAISLAIEEPLHHLYRIEVTENMVILTDDSLYVSGEIPHEPDKELKDANLYRDDVMDEIYRMLEKGWSKDKVLQNFQFERKGKISFRYVSQSVKEVLRKEGSLLEAVVFHECRRRGMFDDIRANVEFLWPGGRTKNEIDIIGTKNSKTYFISAKMRMPEKEHVSEVASLCEMFSVEGHAVLVSSYFATGKDEIKGTDYKMRPIAIEHRVEDMQQISGNMSYIGKDGVDVIRGNTRYKKGREFVIASSIAAIVEEEHQE